MNDTTSNAAVLAELESLPMGPLRSRAAKVYSVNAINTMTKKEIIELIKEKMNGAGFAVISADDKPSPGWSRITLHKIPGMSAHPESVSINGYTCYIPKDIKVDVPNKVVTTLKNLKRQELFEDFEEAVNSPRRFQWHSVDAYPLTVHDSTPGPDPREGHEKAKEAKLRPYRAYMKKFGRWPYTKELRAVLLNGKLEGFSSLDMEISEPEAA